MAQSDRQRKKRPNKGGGGSFEFSDYSSEVSAVDDILAAVDAALSSADHLSEVLKPKRESSCGCGG